MNQRDRKKLAKFRAGLIIESVLAAEWRPEDLVEKYGEEEVEKIASEMSEIADKMIRTS